MAKKKTGGVSPKRRAAAKKVIKHALESVRRDKQPAGQRGLGTRSATKKTDSNFKTGTRQSKLAGHGSRAGQTHTATRSKAVLKNIKAKIAAKKKPATKKKK